MRFLKYCTLETGIKAAMNSNSNWAGVPITTVTSIDHPTTRGPTPVEQRLVDDDASR